MELQILYKVGCWVSLGFCIYDIAKNWEETKPDLMRVILSGVVHYFLSWAMVIAYILTAKAAESSQGGLNET